MLKIENILRAIREDQFRISNHAVEEMENDDLDLYNVLHSIEKGEIIEEYPESRITPSCLILGIDTKSNPVHSVWGYFEERYYSVLITVYKPNRREWMEDFKPRRFT